MAAPGLQPEHDLFIEQMKLENTLRQVNGEPLEMHVGDDDRRLPSRPIGRRTGTSAKRMPDTTQGDRQTSQVAEARVGTGPTTVGPSPRGVSPGGWPRFLSEAQGFDERPGHRAFEGVRASV